MADRPSAVLPSALNLPIFRKLAHRRVILASASPRRRDILETIVSCRVVKLKQGCRPEIVPSTFAEDLPKATFEGRLADYPIATAAEKAIEVYERLIRKDDRDPAELVVSADTVVIFPPENETREGGPSHGETSEILEKPISTHEQLRSLMSMSGRCCEVVTGVAIVFPSLEPPGYKIQSISCSTVVHFYDNSRETVQAYVDSNEGIDRAGGFAIQGLGGLLIDRIEGSYDNTVGFPSSAFWRWLGELDDDGLFDEAWR